jgi:hypothetical protein
MTFVGGVDWLKYAKEWLENGIDPELLYEMPLCRLYVLLFGKVEEQTEVRTPDDWKRVRELILAKRGKK